MLNKNVMTFIGCDAEYNESDIVLFGAPFDSTTSYRPVMQRLRGALSADNILYESPADSRKLHPGH